MKFQRKGIFLVFLLSLLPLLNLLHSGLPVSHDGLDHVVRIANFYHSITEGVLIPRWAMNLNWGYGHPILMFLYPLPEYVASMFHTVGFSFIDSYKIVLSVSYVLSGVFMYLWLKEFLDENSSVVGSVLYLFAPYRFIDLYVRGALGEHTAFAFIPLTLFFVLKLLKSQKESFKKKYTYLILGALSFAGLILSHNAISLILLPFLLFYLLFLFYQTRDVKKLFFTGTSLFIGLLFSFFFWFPSFFEGKYTLRDIVTAGEYAQRFIDPKSLIYGTWSYGGSGQFSVQLGIPHLILIAFSVILLNKFRKDKDKLFLLIASLFFLLGSVFLMTSASTFIWTKITTLQKLQFPWRFLSLTVLFSSLVGAISISTLKGNKFLSVLIVIFCILLTFPYWHAKEYKTYSDSFFNSPYKGTTDTGESSPIWSIRFMEHFPKDQIEIIEGRGEIVKITRNSTYHEYVIKADSKIKVRENTLYFPGWNVYDNFQKIPVEFQDEKNRGLMTFFLPTGLHSIEVKFEDTKIRKVANLISFATLSFVLILSLFISIKPSIKKSK